MDIDVSNWCVEQEETLGTNPKRWLQDPVSGFYWLMKDATSNTADGVTYRKGDDWAERIASFIADTMGLPRAKVELASGGHGAETDLGIISRKVISNEGSLVHGNELLAEIGVFGVSTHDRAEYTIEAVRAALESVSPPTGFESMTAFEIFSGYLVLDALIGNTDRHQENWAVISHEGSRRLSPTLDHASSLGFQLNEAQRAERLSSADGDRSPQGYADRAKSRFEGNPSPLVAASQALGSVRTTVRQH